MKMLTPKEAADVAKVSPSLIYVWCNERRLPHSRAGRRGKRGRILIAETDLEAFIKELRVDRHPLLAAFG